MKIIIADEDLTEFDWVAFVAVWTVALGVVVFQPRALVVWLMLIPLIVWARRRKQRAASPAE